MELGYYYANIDTEIGLGDDSFSEDGVLAGIGARWYFREPWSVSLKATRYGDNLYHVAFGVGWGLRPGRERYDEPDEPVALRLER